MSSGERCQVDIAGATYYRVSACAARLAADVRRCLTIDTRSGGPNLHAGGLYYLLHTAFGQAGTDDSQLWLRIVTFALVYVAGTVLLLVLLKGLQLTGTPSLSSASLCPFSRRYLLVSGRSLPRCLLARRS